MNTESGIAEGTFRNVPCLSGDEVAAKTKVEADSHRGAGEDFSIKPCKGQRVFVYTSEKAWREAVVIDSDESSEFLTVKVDSEQQVTKCCVNQVLLSSDSALERFNNLTLLSPVHEASVLSCLEKRFAVGHFYTHAGTTVVALNPCRDVDHLYSREQIQAHHSKKPDLCPHIYGVAESAYSSMVRQQGLINQSIIISGESGAGKTVSTKHLLKYLTIVSHPAKNETWSTNTGFKIEQRILDSNPILEAFGNAATPRNNNSSRFGKFIELQFERSGNIQGGAIQTYLLEKTRMMHQGEAENNFHIFYQMTGLKDQNVDDFPDWLRDIASEISENTFSSVPHNQDCSGNGDISDTVAAMTDIGLSQQQQKEIFQLLLAILYLGNMRFVQANDEGSDLDSSYNSSRDSDDSTDSISEVSVSVSERALERSCQLLGLGMSSLKQSLLHRSLKAGGSSRHSVFVKPIGVAEAKSRRDCLAMLLYSRLFQWLVTFINHQIRSRSFSNTIGLLDIYGFEQFTVNSLEQLCINYANERLQQHYVAHFLHSLQEEYREESVPWVHVDYTDNRPCVDILDGRFSVFSILNEEVYLNRKSDDEALRGRLLQLCERSQNTLRPVRRSEAPLPSFMVQHYAGDVMYSITGLVTKNKDDIPSDLMSVLSASEVDIVQQLFSSYNEPELHCGRKKKTVLTKFKSSLDGLISSVLESDIQYIRCIKPNASGTANLFQPAYVLQQLRACGAIETVNICRRGYPARMVYKEFQQRYHVVLKSQTLEQMTASMETHDKENVCEPLEMLLRQQLEIPNSPRKTPTPRRKLRRRTGLTQQDHARKVCASVLKIALASSQHKTVDLQHQFGRTKIFLTEYQLEQLELNRLEALKRQTVILQSAWRRFCCRRLFKRHLAALRLQRAWRAYRMRTLLKRLMAARVICRACLALSVRRRYLRLRKSAVVLQRGFRRWLKATQRERFAAPQTCSTVSSMSPDITSPQPPSLAASTSSHSPLDLPNISPLPLDPHTSHSSLDPHTSPSSLDPRTSHSSLDPHSPVDPCTSHSSLGPHTSHSSLDPCTYHSPLDPRTYYSLLDLPCTSHSSLDLPRTYHSPLDPRTSHSPLDSRTSHSPLDLPRTSPSPSPFVDGNISDDSGVHLHEPLASGSTGAAPGKRDGGKVTREPPQKRQRMQTAVCHYPRLKGLHVGDGLVTCRRIPKHGARFHTRASVLKYAHRVNRRELPTGLSDACPDDYIQAHCEQESSVDLLD